MRGAEGVCLCGGGGGAVCFMGRGQGCHGIGVSWGVGGTIIVKWRAEHACGARQGGALGPIAPRGP